MLQTKIQGYGFYWYNIHMYNVCTYNSFTSSNSSTNYSRISITFWKATKKIQVMDTFELFNFIFIIYYNIVNSKNKMFCN